MSELIPFMGGGEVAKTRLDRRIAQMRLDGEYEFNDRAQEYTIDLILRAQARVQVCPGAEPMVAQLLQTFVVDVMAIERNMYRRS